VNVNVSAGSLQVAADAALGNSANKVSLNNGAELLAAGSFSSNRQITLGTGGGSVNVLASNTLTLGGFITGGNGLTASGDLYTP